MRNNKLESLDHPRNFKKSDENNSSLINRSYSASRSKGKLSIEERERQKNEIRQWKEHKKVGEVAKKKEADAQRKEKILKKREREQEELEWKAHKVKQYQLQKELKFEQK
mmetsp:Transcript_17044/g.14992  ORF Transcript_17044/g.14992 Transcript_17044/m.14992 type:complete len:110 (+) Transcript_17044:219-548(+)